MTRDPILSAAASHISILSLVENLRNEGYISGDKDAEGWRSMIVALLTRNLGAGVSYALLVREGLGWKRYPCLYLDAIPVPLRLGVWIRHNL